MQKSLFQFSFGNVFLFLKIPKLSVIFSFRPLKILLDCLLSFILHEKSTLSLSSFFPFCNFFQLWLVYFLLIVFRQFDFGVLCHSFLHFYCVWGSPNLLDQWIYSFLQILTVLTIISLKIISILCRDPITYMSDNLNLSHCSIILFIFSSFSLCVFYLIQLPLANSLQCLICQCVFLLHA